MSVRGPTPPRLSPSLALLACLLGTAPVAADELSDRRIQKGIEALVEQLYEEQGRGRSAPGLWDPPKRRANAHQYGVQWGGTTALATYALLQAGESYQTPRLRKPLAFLKKMQPKGTYVRSLRAHVWAALPPRFEHLLKRDVAWLVDAIGAGPVGGSYDYFTPPRQDRVDNSVTQYGVLGVWEGAKRGLPVPDRYWRRVERHFLAVQNGDGGWGYNATDSSTGSMTAAGLACLFITRAQLHGHEYAAPGGGSAKLEKRIGAAMDWFGKHFEADENPGDRGHLFYYLYGVERIGLASGRKFFNEKDWYASGARFLLDRVGRGNFAGHPVRQAFALLFLVRGRVPVFLNKLRVPGHAWNNRPQDVAHLTRWASDTVETKLNWQVVSVDADPKVWLTAPMAYLASHRPLDLSDARVQRLERFTRLGGLLLTTAEGGTDAFNESVRRVVGKAYPGRSLTPVPPDDPIFDLLFDLDGHDFRVRSVHNGVRHLLFHFPRDLSRIFHLDRRGEDKARYWKLMANLYYYATEKAGASPRVAEPVLERSGSGGGPTVRVGRARYDGNWNPEPLAWEMVSRFLHNEERAETEVRTLDLASLADAELPFVHVTGTDAVDFTDAQIAAVRTFVDRGGTVLFETAGGRGGFAKSAERQLTEVLDEKARPLLPTSPLLSGEGLDGFDVRSVDYRRTVVFRMGEFHDPRLRAVAIDGRPRVLFSREDLTHGMLGESVWGVFGYDTASARRIMANLLLWAHEQRRKES